MMEAVQEHRHRQAARGYKRVEVSVRSEDAELFRRLARLLAIDGAKADRLRTVLNNVVPARERVTFQEWMTS